MPEWNYFRSQQLIIRNKIRKFVDKKKKLPAEQGTKLWTE